METLTWNFNENWFSVAAILFEQVLLLLKEVINKLNSNKTNSALNNWRSKQYKD